MPSKRDSILLGGLVVGVLSTSYLGFINFVCCLGVVIGAMVAVWHYASNNSLTIPAGQGAGIGAAAGALGAAIAFVLNTVLTLAGIDSNDAFLNAIIGFMETQAESVSGDDAAALEEQIAELEAQRDAPFTIGTALSGLAIGVLVSAVFGAIGGAIGAAFFKKGGRAEDYDI